MSDIIQIAKGEVTKLEEMLQEIDAFLNEAPDGCLKWQKKEGKIYYYQQYRMQEKAGEKWGRKYIRKEEESLAKRLAQKHYYSSVKIIAEKQLGALKQLVERYPDNKMEAVYDELSIERKCLVSPLQMSVKEIVKQWKEETYEQPTIYAENLKFETEQGELVRSKSEVIIANILYQNREEILYKYERPLKLKINGMDKTIYPDFSMINKRTGKITYWEHAGRMDDPYYAENFVRKMNLYVSNGLLPGRDVILTFETQDSPLDIGVVKKLVRSLS